MSIQESSRTEDLSMLLEQARMLYDMGIVPVPTCKPLPGPEGRCTARHHPVPCQKRGKRALVADYPRFASVMPEWSSVRWHVESRWPCNLAIVVTDDMCVVDCDSLQAEFELLCLCGDALDKVPARERRPGRGRCYLFPRQLEWKLTSRTRLGQSKAIDILAPGSLFVVPPSTNASGFTYSWVVGQAPWETSAPPFLPRPVVELALAAKQSEIQAVKLSSTILPRVAPRAQFLLKADRRLSQLWAGKGKTKGDTSASGYDYELAKQLLASGLSATDVASAIAARPGAHRHDTDYCVSTVVKALASLRRRP